MNRAKQLHSNYHSGKVNAECTHEQTTYAIQVLQVVDFFGGRCNRDDQRMEIVALHGRSQCVGTLTFTVSMSTEKSIALHSKINVRFQIAIE